MSNSPAPAGRRAAFWGAAWSSYWPEILILLAYLAVRLVALTDTLPVFIDEATMISRARAMSHGHTFEPLQWGKWLQVALVSLLRPEGPETLWLARSITALMATASCAAAIGLGRALDSRVTGRLAGLLTVLTPLAVFHERQALADPVMAVFVNLTLVMVALMARTGRWRYALAGSLTLAAGAMSKLTGLFFLVLPGVGALLLARRAHGRGKVALQAALATLLALVLVVGFILYADSQVEPDRRLLTGGGSQDSLWCRHAGLCEGSEPPTTHWNASSKLTLYRGIQAYYLGTPMLSLVALGAALVVVDSRARRAVGFLLVPGLGLGLVVVLVSNWYPVRYLNFTVASLAALAGMVLTRLWGLGHRLAGDSPARRAVVTALFGVVVVIPLAWQLPVDLAWMRSPYTVDLPPPDGQGCTGYGYGYDRVAETMSQWIDGHGGRADVVTKDALSMSAYWGKRVGAVKKWHKSDELRAAVATWVMGGDAVFFADVVPSKQMPDAPFGATLEVVDTFPLPCGDDAIRVRRVVEEGPEIRGAIYEQAFPNPNESEEQYRALASYLIESGAAGAVVVYPPNQLDLLADRLGWGTGLGGVYAIGDSWPLDTGAAADELESLAAEHGDLHVVFLEERRGDPDSFMRAWLDEHLTLVSQDWFGPVELLHYAGE